MFRVKYQIFSVCLFNIQSNINCILYISFVKQFLLLLANGAEVQEALLAKTGQKTVPNVFVGGKHLGGASDTEAAFKDGRLQGLLAGDVSDYDYDLFVVGGGSGGLACSKVGFLVFSTVNCRQLKYSKT